MADNAYLRRMLKKARGQGWLDSKGEASFEQILRDMTHSQISEILRMVQKTGLLNEGQLEQLQAQLEEEDLNQIEMPAKPAVFYLNNVYKSYKTPEGIFMALKAVSLTIYRAEVLAILGFSGSGKSTLLNILGLLSTPDEHSRIYYNGTPYDRLKNRQRDNLRKRDFGFIFQESHLLSHLNALENVALPLRLQNQSTSVCLEKAAQMLGVFMTENEQENKQQFFNKKPAQLSGGQKQRVAAARAMVHDPSIIFADEPTGSLDFDTGQMVMDALLKAAKERRTTVVLVTHNPSQARKYCTRFLWMEGGSLKNNLTSAMESTIRLMHKLSGRNMKLK